MRILFLDLDTLRPDHLGCYGYFRNTSPNIDKIATQGVRFNKYYCSDAPCLPSRSAMLSGRYGIHNGAVNHSGLYADQTLQGLERGFRTEFDTTNLISIFRDANIKCATINSFAERHSANWFNASFNEVYNNTGKRGLESAEEILPDCLSWIEKNAKSDNWLLHINLWDAHTPYRAPAEYGNPFKNEPIPTWVTEDIIKKHNKLAGPHSSMEINMYDDEVQLQYPRQLGKVTNMEEMKQFIDGYDIGIKYMDDHIGYILEALENQGIQLEDLCIIITSDHGENLGELGIYAEHGTADEYTCRIPMIIKWKGGKKGIVDDDFHLNIDLAPTMAQLLGTKIHSIWDGNSYENVIQKGEKQGRDHIILSQCAHVCQRSVRFENWLYVRTYHDGFRLLPKHMLFDLENDPQEFNNIADENPQILQKAAQLYLEWYDEIMETSKTGIDPIWQIIKEGGPCHARADMLEPYIKRLKQTDRCEVANLLLEKYKK